MIVRNNSIHKKSTALFDIAKKSLTKYPLLVKIIQVPDPYQLYNDKGITNDCFLLVLVGLALQFF